MRGAIEIVDSQLAAASAGVGAIRRTVSVTLHSAELHRLYCMICNEMVCRAARLKLHERDARDYSRD